MLNHIIISLLVSLFIFFCLLSHKDKIKNLLLNNSILYCIIASDKQWYKRMKISKFRFYLYCVIKNYRFIIKRLIFVFVILNIIGCIVTTVIAEQNKTDYYNQLKAESNIINLYQTTKFKN